MALVVAAGIVMWRQRVARACAAGSTCAHRALDWITRIAVAKAIVLLGLAYWIAVPV